MSRYDEDDGVTLHDDGSATITDLKDPDNLSRQWKVTPSREIAGYVLVNGHGRWSQVYATLDGAIQHAIGDPR